MSLVFAAITPHPPLAIPSVGKENLEKISKTKEALERLETELYAAKPDILIVISPHGEISPDHFTINLSDKFQINFEQFGDFSTRLEFASDTVLITTNKEKMSNRSPINIISEATLDHGIGVPLFYLARHLKNIKLIPIYFSLLDNRAHFEFGKNLKETIIDSDQRIAVIASGDLSHCLTENAPLPFDPTGKEFDQKLMDFLKNSDSQSIINFDPELLERAAECGLRSIAILLGILNNINFNFELFSYEAPFGVGYLVGQFKLD